MRAIPVQFRHSNGSAGNGELIVEGSLLNDFMVSYIDGQFHTTLDNDAAIATQLNARGYLITASGVKEIRLVNSWRHHQSTAEQQQEQ
jgi:hypothetical protein